MNFCAGINDGRRMNTHRQKESSGEQRIAAGVSKETYARRYATGEGPVGSGSVFWVAARAINWQVTGRSRTRLSPTNALPSMRTAFMRQDFTSTSMRT